MDAVFFSAQCRGKRRGRTSLPQFLEGGIDAVEWKDLLGER